tara:strand:+ start:111 stop:404 length:294 start_codon:yes stop_codon:yes gene_type:complete
MTDNSHINEIVNKIKKLYPNIKIDKDEVIKKIIENTKDDQIYTLDKVIYNDKIVYVDIFNNIIDKNTNLIGFYDSFKNNIIIHNEKDKLPEKLELYK